MAAVFFFLTARQRKLFWILAASMTLNGILEMVAVGSVLPFLGIAAAPELIHRNPHLNAAYVALGFASERDFLVCLGGVVIALILAMNASGALFGWLSQKFVWDVNHRLSCRLMAHYLGMDYLAYTRRNSADLQKNIQVEVSRVSYDVMGQLLGILNAAVVCLFTMAFLLVVMPGLVIGTGIVFGLIYLGIYLGARRVLTRIGQHSLEDNEAKFKAISEAFGAFKIAKLAHRESHFLEVFSRASARFSGNQCRRMTIGLVPKYAVEAVAFSLMVGICLHMMAVRPALADAIPGLGLLALAAYRLMPRIQQIYTSASVLKACWPNLDYLRAELDRGAGAGRRVPSGSRTIPARGRDSAVVEFRNVSFTYPGAARRTIDRVSFAVGENATVGFLGETGSGKTTVINLMLGLFPPDDGEMFVRGVPMSGIDFGAWQKSIGYVPQDLFLLDASVAENVAFGVSRDAIDMNRVREVCALADIGEFIERELEKGYDALVGERGVRLSGGQRQRIGIARALYGDPALLVFDEATSSLDNETEETVMAAVERLAHRRTIVMVAHRLTTLRNCGQVIRMEGGRIVESGAYETVVLAGRKSGM